MECEDPSMPARKNKTTSESGLNLGNNGSKEVYAEDELMLHKMPPLVNHEGKFIRDV